MNYPKTQLLKAAAKEDGRYAMHNVLFEDGKLIATNGKILALLPVTEADDDVPGLIPRQAVELAHRGGTPVKGCRMVSGINGNVRAQNKDGSLVDVTRPDEDAEFPKWRQVMPEVSESTHFSVMFNVSLLHDLCLAMGATTIRMKISKDLKAYPNSPILVTPLTNIDCENASKDAIGVLMPITSDE